MSDLLMVCRQLSTITYAQYAMPLKKTMGITFLSKEDSKEDLKKKRQEHKNINALIRKKWEELSDTDRHRLMIDTCNKIIKRMRDSPKSTSIPHAQQHEEPLIDHCTQCTKLSALSRAMSSFASLSSDEKILRYQEWLDRFGNVPQSSKT